VPARAAWPSCTPSRRRGAAGPASPEIVCFDKQSDWGGLWNYTWRTGLDQHGDPVHGSMYRYLWSNGPKECLEFADYTFDEHFGKPIPSFPPREVLFDYIAGRAKKSNVRQYVQFDSAVRWISFDAARDAFEVTVESRDDGSTRTEEFDHVIVATGHFSTPNMPEYPGFATFPGRVLHSHDFRDAQEFAGKDLLVLGSSYSAEDIALQSKKYGAAGDPDAGAQRVDRGARAPPRSTAGTRSAAVISAAPTSRRCFRRARPRSAGGRAASVTSDGDNNCVEVAFLSAGHVALRDTKARDRAPHVHSATAWSTFLAGVGRRGFESSGRCHGIVARSVRNTDLATSRRSRSQSRGSDSALPVWSEPPMASPTHTTSAPTAPSGSASVDSTAPMGSATTPCALSTRQVGSMGATAALAVPVPSTISPTLAAPMASAPRTFFFICSPPLIDLCAAKTKPTVTGAFRRVTGAVGRPVGALDRMNP
jgi:hypothetical protein